MTKPESFIAVEDVALEKPEKPLVVDSQMRNTGLTEDDMDFLNSLSEKEKTKIFRKVYPQCAITTIPGMTCPLG
jgi:hypothetical protein